LTRPMVVEAFELLSWCCMATPRVASHLTSGRISFGALGCVTLFGGTCRKALWRRHRSTKSQCACSPGIKKTHFLQSLAPRNSERLDLVPKSPCAGTPSSLYSGAHTLNGSPTRSSSLASSFSGLFTRVEIGHIVIGSDGYVMRRSCGSGSRLSQRS
jgi:hypothetical protein